MASNTSLFHEFNCFFFINSVGVSKYISHVTDKRHYATITSCLPSEYSYGAISYLSRTGFTRVGQKYKNVNFIYFIGRCHWHIHKWNVPKVLFDLEMIFTAPKDFSLLPLLVCNNKKRLSYIVSTQQTMNYSSKTIKFQHVLENISAPWLRLARFWK